MAHFQKIIIIRDKSLIEELGQAQNIFIRRKIERSKLQTMLKKNNAAASAFNDIT